MPYDLMYDCTCNTMKFLKLVLLRSREVKKDVKICFFQKKLKSYERARTEIVVQFFFRKQSIPTSYFK